MKSNKVLDISDIEKTIDNWKDDKPITKEIPKTTTKVKKKTTQRKIRLGNIQVIFNPIVFRYILITMALFLILGSIIIGMFWYYDVGYKDGITDGINYGIENNKYKQMVDYFMPKENTMRYIETYNNTVYIYYNLTPYDWNMLVNSSSMCPMELSQKAFNKTITVRFATFWE